MQDVIVRIQDDVGRGPFRPGLTKQWFIDRSDADNLQAWLYSWPNLIERKGIYGMHFGCGCLTEDQLRRWFTRPEYDKLRLLGFHAVRMDVGRILAHDNVQCVFERAKPLKEDVTVFDLYP